MIRTPIVTRSTKDKNTDGENSIEESDTPVKQKDQNSETVPISEQKYRQKKREIKKKMEAEFKVLKNQLSALERRLLRVKTAIDADTDDPNQSVECKQFLQLQLKIVEGVNADYNAHQQRAYGLDINDDTRAGLDEASIEFEQLYGELYIVLTKLLEQTLKKEQSVEQSSVQSSASATVNLSQLPSLKVPLPSFDGSYENWYAFKSMFETIMARYNNESPAIKLYHLRNSLVGKAAGIIDQEVINNNDYNAAWATLTERFEDRRLIIDKHIDTLFDLPKLTHENAIDMRKLLDACTKNVDALKNLGLPVTGLGERMLVNRIALKLDNETRKAWELRQASEVLPSYESTLEFLRERCRVLEKIHSLSKPSVKTPIRFQLRNPTEPKIRASSLVTATDTCLHCSGSHELWKCDAFKKVSLSERYDTLRRAGACFNCLQKGHRTADCSSKHSCKKCSKRHHTTLHPDDSQQKKPDVEKPEAKSVSPQKEKVTESPDQEAQSTFCTQRKSIGKQVLLSTAVVLVNGKADWYPCRVLLDSGSHSNFVSEHFATLLLLKKEPANVSISGLNDINTKVRLKIHTRIKSRTSNFMACLEFFIVPRITSDLPSTKVDCTNLQIPKGFQLADPNFGTPDRVDMLLGAEIFFDMLMSGRMRIPNTSAVLHETQFGWVLSGSVPNDNSKRLQSFCITAEENLNEIVRRFWQIESWDNSDERSAPSAELCIDHFRETHKRTADGRYVVRLPFNELKCKLGDSKAMAERRFVALEKRLDRSPEVKAQYISFLKEYEMLGHMSLNEATEDDDVHSVYYLPHHYVLKPTSTTTRLRVVFDGSAPSDTGISINQTQMVGPTVQTDLISILLNFRSHKFAFTADIPKMYRQVSVHKDDVRYQRILWREDSSHPIRVYDLRTVTYGLASSPFLATMSLRQLAEDEEQKYPLAARAIRKSFYIDDVLTGAATLEQALQLKCQIVDLLREGGFEVHKFCSNSESLLATVPEEQRERCVDITDPTINATMKTLGIAWNPKEDNFTFTVADNPDAETQPTKRSILSQIARIFDPLGFVGPAITAAKIILRELWALSLDWDQPVPTEFSKLWKDYRHQLQSLNKVNIPRWVYSDGACQYELHGFADASDLAYGACLYVRTVRSNGTANMTLVCSKSRILPRKRNNQKEITTPKAELQAALLLSQITVKLLTTLNTDFSFVTLWSDSQIVLCWLQKSPDTLTIFAGNRVRQIQQLTNRFIWQYIPSKENPADLISRGMSPSELEECKLWWHGPSMFHSRQHFIDQPLPLVDEELPELRKTVLVIAHGPSRLPIFDRISRYMIIQRSMAYVIRFCDYIKGGRKQLTTGLPTVSEMQRASTLITRMVQNEAFHKELQLLRTDKEYKLPFQNLNPFIDTSDSVLRVGGRLRNAALSYEHRHQALLPEKHPLTLTLIRYLHRANMHLGQRNLLGVVRQQYWPLRAKNTIRRILHHCIPCFRMQPKKSTQLMGDLPDYRVKPSPVFSHSGVDFAGPLYIRSSANTRHPTTTKGYVCVFVCMATRALHLEAVSDLTTDSFMAALQRFVSRRGLVQKLYSDNGTNFEGANNQMNRLAELFRTEHHKMTLNEYCAPRGIEWSFIPPRSPHFGGIWEAGVKSVKSHLKLILAEHRLTYEALSTVLAQVEAILNSRPLTPASDDPNDLTAITPAHFIIGREFQAIPEPSYAHIPLGRLSRWQFVQDSKQKFWKLWMRDYLHELQIRQRDLKITEFKIGAMVVIIDENLPPLMWTLARIIELHPGKDGHTRVVSLQTKNGVTRRVVKKICLLPLDDDQPLPLET